MSIFDPNFPLHPQSKPAAKRKAPAVRDYEGIMAELMNPKPKPKPKVAIVVSRPQASIDNEFQDNLSLRRRMISDLYQHGFEELKICEMLEITINQYRSDVRLLKKKGMEARRFVISQKTALRRFRVFDAYLGPKFLQSVFARAEGVSPMTIFHDIAHIKANPSHYAEYRKEREAKAGSDKKS